MFPNSPRLTSKECAQLEPVIQSVHDKTSSGAAIKMLNSFRDWVDAAHYYRHEPGSEQVTQPPLSLAIYMVSCGAAHLRWLAELDRGSEGR
jgi:hypothetical protein